MFILYNNELINADQIVNVQKQTSEAAKWHVLVVNTVISTHCRTFESSDELERMFEKLQTVLNTYNKVLLVG